MIDKVGGIILQNKKMLVARASGRDMFFIPGGKREGAESDIDCLTRELQEELNVTLKEARYYKDYIADASGENGKVRVRTYFCFVEGVPAPHSEIEELAWVGKENYHEHKLGNVLMIIVPELIRDRIM